MRRLTLACLVATSGLQAWAHEEQEMLVGRNAAGALVVDSDFPQPVEVPVSIFPGIPGYATGLVAFHSTILDDPTNNLFQLSTAADFRFILLAKDPGLEVWNDTGTGYMATNESYFIGPSPFDSHPIWTIVDGTVGTAYSLTLKLRDLNGVYADSDPFVLSFTPLQLEQRLNIAQPDSQHVALLWPANAVSWELQCAASLTTTNWTSLTNVPVIVGTNRSVTISTTEAQQFFRLQKL